MSESIQLVMVFCLTIIAIIGLTSAVVFLSKGQISYSLKARTKLPGKTEAEIGFRVNKEIKKENR